MAGITVGFDGSPGAERALRWAMTEAAARRALLTVLTVHPAPASAWTGQPITVPADEAAVQRARQVAEEAVAKAAAELGDSVAALVTVRSVSGFPAEALIQASADADLVVVGSRGTNPVRRLLVGSVSNEVLHHAHGPVVVVPGDRP